jgi:hypothetical protein
MGRSPLDGDQHNVRRKKLAKLQGGSFWEGGAKGVEQKVQDIPPEQDEVDEVDWETPRLRFLYVIFVLFPLEDGMVMRTLVRNFSRRLNFGSLEDKFRAWVSVLVVPRNDNETLRGSPPGQISNDCTCKR